MSDFAEVPELEIVTIGDELLLGETVDSNSAWLGRRLAAEGIRVSRRASVGDDDGAIRSAVGEALERTGTVVCTGGLGPTRDDRTREAVAGLFGRALRLDEGVLAAIRDRFASRGLEMPAVNRRQAEVPDGARVFANPRGTAPGLALEDAAGRLVVLLPGVPFELRALVEEQVLPFLMLRWVRRGRPIRHRVLRTTGIAESVLAERVEDLLDGVAPLRVAFLPAPVGVDLRLTSWGGLTEAEAEAALNAAEAKLSERLAPYAYGRDDEDLADAVGRFLTERGLTLAVAESCTGGLIGKRVTDRPGASVFFLGGVIAYDDAVKLRLLGVPRAVLTSYGAVSRETVIAMADGVRALAGADTAVAVTGIAGPGGATPEKPVGTVWIAAAAGEDTEARRHLFPGDREEIRDRAAQAALALLWERLRRGA